MPNCGDRMTIYVAARVILCQDQQGHARIAPTSHERASSQPWDASYRDGPPAPGISAGHNRRSSALASEGTTGTVFDVGCGTGDNALLIAALGLSVLLGVDVAETALAIAREKAAARNLNAEFALADAFHLDRLDAPSTPSSTAASSTPSTKTRSPLRREPGFRRRARRNALYSASPTREPTACIPSASAIASRLSNLPPAGNRRLPPVRIERPRRPAWLAEIKRV
ncbi:MAG: class I SAM-dependent methyltransferase [Bryobacterales bacterium]